MIPAPTLSEGHVAGTQAGLDEVVGRLVGDGRAALAPGAVVLVARRTSVVRLSACGYAQTHDGWERLQAPRPMLPDSVFDLASITKVAATTAAVMRLVDDGILDLDERAIRWLPEFAGGGKERITIRHLLAHRAGLKEWWPLYLNARNPRQAIQQAVALDLRYPVDVGRHYSDLGFMLLGEILQRATGEPLDVLVGRLVHAPLGMDDTRYGQVHVPHERLVATSTGNPHERAMIETRDPYPVEGDPDDFDGWRRHTLVGEANDGNAFYAFDGVAGHAGLFSTARDLAVFGQALLNDGGYGDFRLCSPETIAEFTEDRSGEGQGLGFRVGFISMPDGETVTAFGHGGFTGTELLVAPEMETVIVLLTNRQHPRPPYRSIEGLREIVMRDALAAG